MPPALLARAVQKRFGSLTALESFDLTVPQGGFFGLLGPNGAGKSTFINIVAGLARADHGSVEVMGHDVVKNAREARHALGVVPQELVIDPFFSIRELLRIQAGYYGLGRAHWDWLERLLTALELQPKATSTLRQLSGGMKRRVMIAQALAHKPQVVILDEPTAGVDVELRRSLWEFVRELHREGHTIILTTHYLEEAETLCDQIAIMQRGKLRAVEDKQTLLLRHPYRYLTLKLLNNNTHLIQNIPENLLDKITNKPEINNQDLLILELKLHKKLDLINDILDQIRNAGMILQDIQTRDARLEDIFIEMTH